MMSFSLDEILVSIVSAFVYGLIFAFCISLALIIKSLIKGLPCIIREMLFYEKLLPLPQPMRPTGDEKNGPFLLCGSIFLFALGFSLLSYFSLDGEIRLYMLIISFASFYLSNFVFFKTFNKIALLFIRVILNVLAFAIRVIILPIKAIFGFFKKKSLTKDLKSK